MERLDNPRVDHTGRLAVDSAVAEPNGTERSLLERNTQKQRELHLRMVKIFGSGRGKTKEAYYRTKDQDEPQFTRAWIRAGRLEADMEFVSDEATIADGRVAVFENSEVVHLRWSRRELGWGGVPGETLEQKIEVLEALGQVLTLIEDVNKPKSS